MLHVIVLSAAYVAVGSAVLLALERPWIPRLWAWPYVAAWLILSAGYWLWQRPTLTRERVASAALVAWLVIPLQDTFQRLKQAIGPTVGFPLDPLFAKVDAALHGGPAWELGAWLFTHTPSLMIELDRFYSIGWLAPVLVFLVWASWTDSRERSRILAGCILLWAIGGSVGAWLFASAGPCYSGDPQFAPLLAHLEGFNAVQGQWQAALWRAYSLNESFVFAGISAMPSMHVAMAAYIALVISRHEPRLRWLVWSWAIVIQIGSVMTGWHYAIDGYVGAVIAVGCWQMAGAKMPSLVVRLKIMTDEILHGFQRDHHPQVHRARIDHPRHNPD